jgi:hypothetical protein
MANRSKAKGTSWETRIVNYLLSQLFRAKRKVLSGSEDRGDIEIEDFPWLVIEAKNEKTYRFPAYVEEAEKEAVNAGAEIGVAWVHRQRKAEAEDGFVIMSGATFVKLLKMFQSPVE